MNSKLSGLLFLIFSLCFSNVARSETKTIEIRGVGNQFCEQLSKGEYPNGGFGRVFKWVNQAFEKNGVKKIEVHSCELVPAPKGVRGWLSSATAKVNFNFLNNKPECKSKFVKLVYVKFKNVSRSSGGDEFVPENLGRLRELGFDVVSWDTSFATLDGARLAIKSCMFEEESKTAGFCEPSSDESTCQTPDGKVYKLDKSVNQVERHLTKDSDQSSDTSEKIQSTVAPK